MFNSTLMPQPAHVNHCSLQPNTLLIQCNLLMLGLYPNLNNQGLVVCLLMLVFQVMV